MVNLANIGALRARKHGSGIEGGDDEDCRPWRRRLSSMAVSSSSFFRLSLLLLLLAAIVTACITLPVEKVLLSPFSCFSFQCPPHSWPIAIAVIVGCGISTFDESSVVAFLDLDQWRQRPLLSVRFCFKWLFFALL